MRRTAPQETLRRRSPAIVIFRSRARPQICQKLARAHAGLRRAELAQTRVFLLIVRAQFSAVCLALWDW